MSRVRTWSLVVLSASVVGLAGCSSSSATPPTTTVALATVPVQDRSPAGTAGKEPTVTVPPPPAPSKLESADLIVGTGAPCCGRQVVVDELIVATGFRPDLDFVRELRIQLDPAIECPVALAPLIDPNQHSCGTVRPHGAPAVRKARVLDCIRDGDHPHRGGNAGRGCPDCRSHRVA